MPDADDIPAHVIPVAGFRSRKAAQICAWFALQCEGQIERLKLIKLVYFAEREFLHEHHTPMLFDEFYSLFNGPICSSTLDGINGVLPPNITVWSDYIAKNGNIVVPTQRFEEDELDELSIAEWDTLKDIWHRFGHKTASQLRNWSHDHCPEWKQVDKGSRLQIQYKDILRAFEDDEADYVDEQVKEIRESESFIGT